MELLYEKDAEAGDAYPVTIFQIVEQPANEYGTQIKIKMVDDEGRIRIMFAPTTVTPRNRTGRLCKSMFGEIRAFNTDALEGQTATLIYVAKRGATDGSAVADILRPRKPGAKEDPAADVKLALEREAGFNKDKEAAF